MALSALLLGVAAMPAHAGCDYPSLVLIPAKDKLSAKEEKKITEATHKYMDAMKAYVTCIQGELQAVGGDNAPDLYKKVLVGRNNNAVAEAEAVQKWYLARVSKASEAVGPPQQQQKKD
jgi:hypothetical protein